MSHSAGNGKLSTSGSMRATASFRAGRHRSPLRYTAVGCAQRLWAVLVARISLARSHSLAPTLSFIHLSVSVLTNVTARGTQVCIQVLADGTNGHITSETPSHGPEAAHACINAAIVQSHDWERRWRRGRCRCWQRRLHSSIAVWWGNSSVPLRWRDSSLPPQLHRRCAGSSSRCRPRVQRRHGSGGAGRSAGRCCTSVAPAGGLEHCTCQRLAHGVSHNTLTAAQTWLDVATTTEGTWCLVQTVRR